MKRYAWLLRLYPRAFRDRFAPGMHAALSEEHARARRRGGLAVLFFMARAVVHAMWFGLAERLPRPAVWRSFFSTDVRDAFRALLATPIVTAIAIASLALGIGANTALFSILNSLVLKQLPVPEPQNLVMVGRTDWTNPIWEEIRARQFDLFESAGAWSGQQFNLAASGPADPVDGAYVSGGLFRTLGIGTTIGRPLMDTDDVRGGGADGHAVVISDRFWQRRFGGDPGILGRQLTIDRVRFTIVGVAPRGFHGPEVGQAVDLFVPLAAEAAIRGRDSALDGRTSWWLQVMGRLRPDQNIELTFAKVDALRPAIRDATMPPTYNAEYRAAYLADPIALVPTPTGVSTLRDRFAQPLTIIMIVVAAVLLISCANIANLMLARASSRGHEMSLRLALGASRIRIGCQLLVESLLVAGAGGVAGLAVAWLAGPVLVRQLDTGLSSATLDLTLDWRVLAFTAAVSLGATLLFGLAPVLGLGRIEPNAALKESSRTVAGEGRSTLRNTMVVAQVALSFVLVAGAGLFVRTFATLVTTPLGFEASGLLVVRVDAPPTAGRQADRVALGERIADAAASVPGVSRASLSFMTPMSGRNWTHRVQVSGGPALSRAEQTTWVHGVAPGWFDTYGMRILAGRDFSASDTNGSEQVIVVNQAFVRRFVVDGNPLGQRVTGQGLGHFEPSVIVGVVNDAVYRTARIGIVPTMYLPMRQAGDIPAGFSVTTRIAGDRAPVERALTEAISRVDPQLTFSLRDYSDQLRATVVQERLVAWLAAFFGALAMLLAALGLYGVTSYSVSRRRPEIAVRMALGASAGSVVRLVLHRVALLIAIGAGAGVALSLWAAKFVSALLFGVDARDPLTLVGTAAVLGAAGLCAGWLPARKASRLDPTSALRT